MSKTLTLTEKLKGYSLLAGSLLASAAANAQVMYTDIPDIELGGDAPATLPESNLFALDLNNDGTTDFNIYLNFYTTGEEFWREYIKGEDVIVNRVFTYTIDYIPWALKLNCGFQVPPGTYFFGQYAPNLAFQFPPNNQLNWNNVVDKYIGLKFSAAGDFHYGWLRLDVNTDPDYPNIVIKSYAYEATPQVAIEVCDTGFGVGMLSPLAKVTDFEILPNPSNGNGVIRLQQPLNGDLEFTINDATGRRVHESVINMKWDQTEMPFDFSSFSPGLYFIHLKSETTTLSTKWVKK